MVIHHIVGILAFDKMADESASCTIELTEESMTMLTELELLASSSSLDDFRIF